MLLVFSIATIFAFIVCLPPWLYARRRARWFCWDLASFVIPELIWFGLAIFGVGAQSLANLIEVFMILLTVIVVVYLRVFLLDRLTPHPRFNSFLAFCFCCLSPLLLRLSMPILPE